MNYATRGIGLQHWRNQFIKPARISGTTAMVTALVAIMLLSAFTVIYLKDLNRRLFIHYQQLQQVEQRETVNWSRLLLEQSTLSTQARVEQIASKKLHMEAPTNKSIVILEK